MMDTRYEECLQLVADRHRLALLQELRAEGTNGLSVDDLVTRLHSSDPITTMTQPTDRRELAIQLYHTHLPKLDDHGVVDFNADRGIVQYQPDSQMEAVLDSLPDEVSLASP